MGIMGAAMAANLRAGEHPPAFPLKHLAKDCKLIVDTACELGAPAPVGLTLLHPYRLGWTRGWGDEDIPAIMRVMEHLSGR